MYRTVSTDGRRRSEQTGTGAQVPEVKQGLGGIRVGLQWDAGAGPSRVGTGRTTAGTCRSQPRARLA